MKKLIVLVFSIVLFGSCGQGSQIKDDNEIVDAQLTDSLITEDYLKNNYSFYGAWKNIYNEGSSFEFENYYIYFNGNDGRIKHTFKYKDQDSIFDGPISKWVKNGDRFLEIFKGEKTNSGFRIEEGKYLLWDEGGLGMSQDESESYDKKQYIKIL